MMRSLSKRGWIRVVSYIAAAMLVLVGYCISIYQSNLAYRHTITNSYLRAFSQVVASVDRIDSTMQKELYVVTPAMVSVLSAEIQAEAATAQEALGELPYANIELEQTAAFLAKVGDYASALSRSAAANGSLSQEEMDNLEAMSSACSQLRERLNTLANQLNEGSADLENVKAVEQRLSQMTEGGGVLAGSAFENVETNFPELPTMTYDGPFSDHLASSQPKMLEGLGEISAEEALIAAAACTGYRESIFSLAGEVEGEIPCYTCTASVDGGELTVWVTKAGGKVMSITNSRSVGTASLTPDQGAMAAYEFLNKNGFENMVETYRYNNDGRLTVNFAYRENDVLCYPDLCSVTVALDTGSILSFECTSYLSNHTQRTLEVPAVSVDDARAKVSPKLDVLREQLALIPTDGEYEVLCWEFVCEAENGQHYIVCINAATGAEQKILILLEDENGTLAL